MEEAKAVEAVAVVTEEDVAAVEAVAIPTPDLRALRRRVFAASSGRTYSTMATRAQPTRCAHRGRNLSTSACFPRGKKI